MEKGEERIVLNERDELLQTIEAQQQEIDRLKRRERTGEDMDNDEKCIYRESCGYDFCHGEGICPEFEKGKPPKETEKESEVEHDG